MQTDTSSALMTAAQAASYLGVGKATLDKLRVTGGGPAYVKLGLTAVKRNGTAGGGSVRYRRSDLDSFIEERVRRSTSKRAIATAEARS